MNSYILFLIVLVVSCLAEDHDYYDNDEASSRRQSYSVDPGTYNPSARDFTDRCMRLAQYSGEKACDVFNICCSEDNVLSKLNGDKCKISDPTNGCDMAGNRIQWSQCRAFNCTDEITTTTTTTRRPYSSTTTSTPNTTTTIVVCEEEDRQTPSIATTLNPLGIACFLLLVSTVLLPWN